MRQRSVSYFFLLSPAGAVGGEGTPGKYRAILLTCDEKGTSYPRPKKYFLPARKKEGFLSFRFLFFSGNR